MLPFQQHFFCTYSMLNSKYLFGLVSKNETMLFPIWTTRQRIALTNNYTHTFTEDCFVILFADRANAASITIDDNLIAEDFRGDTNIELSLYVRRGSIFKYTRVESSTADRIDIY